MTESRTIEIDLWQDLVTFFRGELVRLGFDVEDIADDTKLVRVYLGVCRRLVSLEPRQILKSSKFSCSPEHRKALTNIECIIKNGGDLTPYLSKKIRRLDYNDPMLNHWGIHHLHLDTSVESDGFIKRTGALLYCRFEAKQAYFIDILPHGNWTQQQLIHTMHENWPEYMSQFRLNGITGTQLSEEEIKTFRKKNINYAIEMDDGTTYCLPGGGVAGAGINILDVTKADFLFCSTREEQKRIIDNIDEIATEALKQCVVLPNPARFSLHFIKEKFYAVETDCKVAISVDLFS